MNSTSRVNRRRLRRGFETLEARQMLAGNVQVQLVGGDLLVTGDNASNSLLVERIDDDSIKITGLGTTVNGTFSAKTFHGVTDDVGFNMRGGNDALILKNIFVNDDLGILMGTGNDTLTMTGVNVSELCGIDMGTGHDAVSINGLRANLGLGIITRTGNDAVSILNSTIYGELTIQTNGGVDAVSLFNVKNYASDGIEEDIDPYPVLAQAFFGYECGVTILTGDSNDAVAVNKLYAECFLAIDTDGGVDSAALANSTIGSVLEFDLRSVDTATIGPQVGLFINTGLSNDAVSIVNTTVYGVAAISTLDSHLNEMASITENGPAVADGNDAVSIYKLTVLSAFPQYVPEFEVETSNVAIPVDLCGSLVILTGNGSDAVALNTVKTDCYAEIITSDGSKLDGNDAVSIVLSEFGILEPIFAPFTTQFHGGTATLFIFTGIGSDAVTISFVTVYGNVRIDTSGDGLAGDGTDRVAINKLAADEIFVQLGAGNYDTLSIANSTALKAWFYGGPGIGDTLVRANNQFGSQVQAGFEFVV